MTWKSCCVFYAVVGPCVNGLGHFASLYLCHYAHCRDERAFRCGLGLNVRGFSFPDDVQTDRSVGWECLCVFWDVVGLTDFCAHPLSAPRDLVRPRGYRQVRALGRALVLVLAWVRTPGLARVLVLALARVPGWERAPVQKRMRGLEQGPALAPVHVCVAWRVMPRLGEALGPVLTLESAHEGFV